MANEMAVSREEQLTTNLSAALVCMPALLGCLCELANRDEGPFRAYVAPLRQLAVTLVELGCITHETDAEDGEDDAPQPEGQRDD